MPTSTSAPTVGGRLGDLLPRELQLEIIERLDYGAAVNLAATNHYHQSIIDPPTLVSTEEKIEFLREAEFFPQHCSTPADMEKLCGPAYRVFLTVILKDPPPPCQCLNCFPPASAATGPGFACTGCFRIKKWHHFATHRITGDKAKPASLAAAKSANYLPNRLCNDCVKPDVLDHRDRRRVIGFCPFCTSDRIWLCECCPRLPSPDHDPRESAGCPDCGLCVRVCPDEDDLSCPSCGGELVHPEVRVGTKRRRRPDWFMWGNAFATWENGRLMN